MATYEISVGNVMTWTDNLTEALEIAHALAEDSTETVTVLNEDNGASLQIPGKSFN